MSIRNTLLGGAVLLAASTAPMTASAGADPLLGEIMEVGFNFCPRGWAQTNGQLVSIASNSALFALLGTTYGGDGRTTFGLPDLRGRVSVGVGNGPGLSDYRWGQRAGVERVTLTTSQIPTHTHRGGIRTAIATGNSTTPFQSYLTNVGVPSYVNGPDITPGENGQANRFMAEDTVYIEPSQGGSQAHENRPPSLAIYKCIATQGIFPSRN